MYLIDAWNKQVLRYEVVLIAAQYIVNDLDNLTATCDDID